MKVLRAAITAGLAAISALGCAQAAGPQQTASPASHTPAEAQAASVPSGIVLQSQTNLVLVDVAVTAGGKPVRGLDRAKFHVFENGKPQQLTVFEEHEPGEALPPSLPPKLEADTYINLPQRAQTDVANVLLFDALNTPLIDQMSVRQKMLPYLKTIPPGTSVAVFKLSSQLRMVQGFTTDYAAIMRSVSDVNNLKAPTFLDASSGQPNPVTTEVIGDLTSSRASATTLSNVEGTERDYASYESDARVGMTLDAMKQIARYLGNLPGRKNLIWVSGSFPLSINPGPTLNDPFESMRNYADAVHEADRLLSAARVAVYPIDGRGIPTPPSANVANDFGGGVGGAALAASQADAKFQQQTAQEHFAMQQIADETGGEPFFNTNGIDEAVGQAIADGSAYYTLGYVPDSKIEDGKYRRLKVTINGDYRARYRRGYFTDHRSTATDPADNAAKALSSALQMGMPPVSDLIFKVRVVPEDHPPAAAPPAVASSAAASTSAPPSSPSASAPGGALAAILKGPTRRYRIDYDLATRRLSLIATADGKHHARVQFGVVAYDSTGRRLNYADRSVDLGMSPALYASVMQRGVPYHQEIDLPQGSVFLRVLVRDLGNNLIGAMEIPLTVSKP